jgi:hypothetical protein
MGIISKFARLIGNWNELGRMSHKLDEVVAGMDNQSRLINEKSEALVDGVTYLASRLNVLIDRIEHVAELQQAQLILQREGVDALDEVIVSLKPRASTYPTLREPAAKLDGGGG